MKLDMIWSWIIVKLSIVLCLMLKGYLRLLMKRLDFVFFVEGECFRFGSFLSI